ncbi:cleft lip and palate transmembrane protein 1-domain-containing protein [Crucibulum laeve]|uniref:Cleft lip and palate transmembrane protein 1-domain-containing protein n=1 Tax=Crucibulum laeve TaxID=68775 RepID=A0A5C3MGR0_9AGAR|nr:cleft lip and palate transmembrane protein 1-domain-containing protein [Crucibulum laeve]
MPDPAPVAAPAGAPAPEQNTMQKVLKIGQQVFIAWAISQLISKFMQSPKPETPAVVDSPVTANSDASKPVINPWEALPVQALPEWPLGQKLDMHVYLSTSPNGDPFTKWTAAYRKSNDEGLPHFVWGNITFGDWNDARVAEFDVKFPESVLRNGSLWADIFLAKNGANPDPRSPKYDPYDLHHVRKLLTPYLAKVKARKEKSLLGGNENAENAEEEKEEADVIVPHWHKNITLALVSDASVIPYANVPAPLLEHIHLVPGERDETGTKGFYKPIVFPNEFWHLRSHYIELNETTPSLPLQITFQPMTFFKFQIFASMTHGFNEAAKQQGGAGAELDEVKRMLLETNPWFLGLTGLVSLLHVLFEMLAFKSDVSHWRQKKEMVGVSVRTIVTNVFVQIVILLYLIDNNENTSWMILMGSGMGVLVEAWKVTKAVDISVIPAPAGSLIPYKLDIQDKHVLNEDEKKTQEYDKLAFRYVSYVAIPTLLAYTGYSLVYDTHKGWYSFVISTLTSFVYMFGFAQLVPQLIINYKLKSVAHMPMKAMIYKTLSTVVDDFFAFCIKMPFLHRLACFRDDLVFLIFLYQRWIYRVDPKRVNEYGQVLATDVDAVGGETKKDK